MSQESLRVNLPVSSEWLQKHDAEPIGEFPPGDILGEFNETNFDFEAIFGSPKGSQNSNSDSRFDQREAVSIPAPAYSDVLDPVLNPGREAQSYTNVTRETRNYALALLSQGLTFQPYPITMASYCPSMDKHEDEDEGEGDSPCPSPTPTPMAALILQSPRLRPRLQSFAPSPPQSPPKPQIEERLRKRVMHPAPPTPSPHPVVTSTAAAPVTSKPLPVGLEERLTKRVAPSPPSPPPPPPPVRRAERATAAAAVAAAAFAAAEAAAAAAAAAAEEEEEEEEDEYYIDEEEYEEEEEEEEPTKPDLEVYFTPGPFNGYNDSSTFFNSPTMAKGYYTNKFLFQNNVDDIPGYQKFEHKLPNRTSRGYAISSRDGAFTREDIYDFIFSPKKKDTFVYEKLGPSREKKKAASGFFRARLCHQEYGMATFTAPELKEWYRKSGGVYVFNPPARGT